MGPPAAGQVKVFGVYTQRSSRPHDLAVLHTLLCSAPSPSASYPIDTAAHTTSATSSSSPSR